MNNLSELIKNKAYTANENDTIILKNRNMEPVGALYLTSLRNSIENIVVCETKTAEKYYIYLNGIAVFFSYYSLEKK